MAVGYRTLRMSLGLLALTVVIQVSGYLDLHNLSPVGWPILSLGAALLVGALILWSIVRLAMAAYNLQWGKFAETLLFIALLLSLNIRPAAWSNAIDRMRFFCCSTQERQSLEIAAKIYPARGAVLIAPWGESGFAGSNLFTYLVRTRDEVNFQTISQSKEIGGIYVSNEKILNSKFRIRPGCVSAVRHLTGDFYVVRSNC